MQAIHDRDLEAVHRLFAPTATWHNTSVFPDERVIEGPDRILDFFDAIMEGLDETAYAVERVAEAAGGVVVGFHTQGTGRASGVPLDVHWAVVVHVRDERISRIDVYGSFERALEAAS